MELLAHARPDAPREFPRPKVRLLRAALHAGAHAFVSKDEPYHILLGTIRALIARDAGAGPRRLRTRQRPTPSAREGDGAAELTFRERQVLIGVAQGYSSKEIAATLNRSVRTIVKHRSKMMRKLSLHDVSAVTRYAIARGFLCVAGG